MCQEFAVPNCVESATFDPAKSLTEASKSITHHFQVRKEGVPLLADIRDRKFSISYLGTKKYLWQIHGRRQRSSKK